MTPLVLAFGLTIAVAGSLLLLERPWLAPWGIVFLFGTTSELRLRVSDLLGVSKDAYVLLLLIVTAVSLARRRSSWRSRLPPPWVSFSLGTVVLLYVLNLGGSFDVGWLLGTRLLVEPVLLMILALLVHEPRRVLHHLTLALCWFLPAQAVLAWVQQAVGLDTLVYGWGYAFGSQVRLTSSGGLRTSGSFEDPFALASFAVVGACVAVSVASRRQAVVLGLSSVAILGAAQVRTAALQVALLGCLVLLRRRRVAAAAVGIVGVLSGAMLAGAAYLTSSTVPGGPVRPLLLTLNGRFDAWAVAYEGPTTLLRGNGVGAFGAGSTRAGEGLLATSPRFDATESPTGSFAGDPRFIDSSWLQVLSDVGLIGVLALVAWVVGHARWVSRPAQDGVAAAWLVLMLLAVSVLDWTARTTLGSYPTGFLSLYVLGLATATTVSPVLPRRSSAAPSAVLST